MAHHPLPPTPAAAAPPPPPPPHHQHQHHPHAKRTLTLPPRSEFRFELDPNERISLRPIANSGDAEVFGAELLPTPSSSDRWYTFADDAKLAVSTWNGCQLEMIGSASTEYVADDDVSPVHSSYSNLHLVLERRRLEARNELRARPHNLVTHHGVEKHEPDHNDAHEPTTTTTTTTQQAGTSSARYSRRGQGPRVMVVGASSSGKTSLVKLLANYALRSPAVSGGGGVRGVERKHREGRAAAAATAGGSKAPTAANAGPNVDDGSDVTGWFPVVVNLDPGPGATPLPCTYSLLPLVPLPSTSLPSVSCSHPLGLTTPTTGALTPTPSLLSQSSPLSLWLGRESFRDNPLHATRLVDALAQRLEQRLERDARARTSGVLIDTEGVTTADARGRFEFLQHCIRAFKVDLVVVLGHEKLNIELSRAFAAGSATTGGGPVGGGPTTAASTYPYPRPPGQTTAADDDDDEERRSRPPQVHVVKLPKSGGVVELDEAYKARQRSAQIKAYFYGGGGGNSSRPGGASGGGGGGSEAGGVSSSGATTSNGGTSAAPSTTATATTTAASTLVPPEPLGGLPALSPYSLALPLELLEVYRVGVASLAPSSALPIGADRTVTQTQLSKLRPNESSQDGAALLNAVLALVEPVRGGGGKGVPDSQVEPPPTDDEVVCSAVLGFVYVSDIDAQRKRLTVLSPSAGRLPSKTALIGTLDWQDT